MSGQITERLVTAAQRINANSAPCGIGAGLQSLNQAISRATTQVEQVLQNAADIVSAIQTLPQTIAREIQTVATEMVDGLVGEITSELDKITLPDEIRTLMSAVNDPVRFVQQYIRIENLFPDINLNELLGQISLPGFNLCSMVPNIEIIGGQTTEQANQVPPSSGNAEAQPPPAPIPTPETPVEQPNTSIAAQRVIVEELPPIGENRGLTEQQRQSRTSQYYNELLANTNQRAAILTQLENAVPGSDEYNRLLDERDRLNEESTRIRANRPN
jgi:hypothetical protein